MPQPARTTRKSKEIRRREIAKAAIHVIGEQGATAITAAVLAGEVGLTSGALFRHFASLDEILEAAVDLGIRRIEETFPPDDLPPTERLRHLARQRVALLRANPGLAWLLLSDQVYLTVPARAVENLRGLAKRSRAYLLAALREGARDGSLRSDLEPEVMLVVFTGTVHALIGARGVHRTTPGRRRRRDSERVLDALLALLAHPGSERERS